MPERLLSAQMVDYFSNRLNFSLIKGAYFVSYVIPTESGHVDTGSRLLNWVWYCAVADGSPEMAAVFTDVHGKQHANMVPQGLVAPAVWTRQVARFAGEMTAPLDEAVSKTARPFVTKVREAESGASSFLDGRVMLVGDALATFRSHLGMATEQAARHCLQMDRVWRGEMTAQERYREATLYAKRFLLLNRIVGLVGMGWAWAVLRTAVAYVWLCARGINST